MFRKLDRAKVFSFLDLIDLREGQTISSSICQGQDFDIQLYAIARGEAISFNKSYSHKIFMGLEGRGLVKDGKKGYDLSKDRILAFEKSSNLEKTSQEGFIYMEISIEGDEFMDTIKNIEKSELLKLEDLIDYGRGQVSNLTLVKRDNLNIAILALDKGEKLSSHSASGDALVQCLDGRAKIIIDQENFIIEEGQAIVLPKDIAHSVEALENYKMLLTLVK